VSVLFDEAEEITVGKVKPRDDNVREAMSWPLDWYFIAVELVQIDL
jgi:hypothetical protein